MELLFEIVLQFLGEILLQLFAEILVELGFRSLAAPLRRSANIVLAIIGLALWGAAAGGISLWVLPESPIHDLALRKLNLLITPLIAGAIMMLIGRARNRRGQRLVRPDRFGYAFVFALAMAVVRYIWVK